MISLTPKQIADNVAAVKVKLEGRPVEFKGFKASDEWLPLESVDFNFMFDAWLFRPAHVPVTRWWNRSEDVPAAPAVWIKCFYEDLQELVVEIALGGLALGRDKQITEWEKLQKERATFSLDRKTWQPCTVTEEVK